MKMGAVAPCLNVLRDDIDRLKPDRNRSLDGAIGDSAHKDRESDHNINRWGYCTARDFTTIGWTPEEKGELFQKLAADWRTAYIIHDRTIYSRRNDFQPSRYTRQNPHKTHFHISVLNDLNIGSTMGLDLMRKAWADTSPWLDKLSAPTPQPSPKGWGDDSMPLGLKSHGPRVAALQKGLMTVFPAYAWPIAEAGGADGYFGEATKKVVMEFQRRARLKVDGVVGNKTAASLRSYGVRF